MSLLDSFVAGQSSAQVAAAIAALFPAYAETGDVRFSTNAAWPTGSAAVIQKLIAHRDLTIAAIKVLIGTASGNIDAGIYLPSGSDYARQASSGSTPAAGTGAIQTLTLSAPVTIAQGTIFAIAVAADNTTVTLARANATSSALFAEDGVIVQKAASFPLPLTLAAAFSAGAYAPWARTA